MESVKYVGLDVHRDTISVVVLDADGKLVMQTILATQAAALQSLRREARRELLVESRKHDAVKLLCTVPFLRPIRSAVLLARVQTPHRFRAKRQFWAYCGLALETRSSASTRRGRTQIR